jgi:hypothetical protein
MRWNSQAYVHPEHIPLFLPSEIADHDQRVASCVAGLPDLEFDLHQGEVRDAARRTPHGPTITSYLAYEAQGLNAL